jgi:alkaline phosphatase
VTARRSAALAVAVVAAAGLAAAGYWFGRGGRWGATRAVEIDDVPIGALGRPLDVALPALPAAPVANVVLLVGDGMGATQVEAARWAAFGTGGRFVFERFPVVGLTSTAASGSPVTDSAAAATALATGVATRYGAVGVASDGRPLVSILEAARDAGFATGLVTTSAIVDATPAAFVAHRAKRAERAEIAVQVAESHVDLLIGGGRDAFDDGDLLAAARARGVTVIEPDGLAAATALPLWALLPGRLDRPGGAPPLPDWATRALDLISRHASSSSVGFFLMIEEEGIDSAAHVRDLAAMTRAQVRFDGAVAAAARFAASDGRTLVLVVGDHATGGLSIDSTTTATRLRVVWASGKHTGEPVPLFAYGPAGAAERFGGSYFQGEVARRLAALLGLDLSSNWSDPR